MLTPLARMTGRLVPAGLRAHVRGRIEVQGTAAAASPDPGALVLHGLLLEGALAVTAGQPRYAAHRALHARAARTVVAIDRESAPADQPVAEHHRRPAGRAVLGPASTSPTASWTARSPPTPSTSPAARLSAPRDPGRSRRPTASSSARSSSSGGRSAACASARCPSRPAHHDATAVIRQRPRATRQRPVFSSLRYGDPGYGMLAPTCPDSIARGAENQGEMGAWHFLQAPQRLRNLQIALDEYLRFGLEAGVIVASPQS